MSGGSPVGNALANSQQQTPMGGGTSPLNTGGGMSGGFGGGQQNSGSLLMRPENPTPYTGPTDPSQFLNKINAGLGGWLSQQQQPMRSPFSSVNSTTQQDMMRGGSGMPFGQRLGQLGFGDQQMAVPGAFNPSEFMNYGRQPQQQFAPLDGDRGGPIDPSMKRDRRLALGQMLGYDPGPQQPELSDVVGHFGDMQYRPQQQQPLSFDDYYKVPQQQTQQAYRIGEKEAEYQRYRDNFGKPSGMQVAQPQPMRNPFQPDPSMVAEEYPAQSYGDMRYRPQPYNPYQQQMQQMRQFQQPSPFRGGSFMQNFAPYQSGLQSLMGQLRGRPASRPAGMQAVFPQSFGREQRYSVPAYSADYSGMSSATRAAMEAEAAKAAQAAQAATPAYDYNQSNSGW